MRISLPMNDPDAEGVEAFLKEHNIVRRKLENSYDAPFEEFWFDGEPRDLVQMVLEFWGSEQLADAFGTPYTSHEDGTFRDANSRIIHPDEAFKQGIQMGMEIERGVIRHDLRYISRDKILEDFV